MATQQIVNKMIDIPKILKEDESINSYQYRYHTPQSQNINDKTCIIIEVNTDNSYNRIGDSFLIIEGQLRKNNATHDAYVNGDEITLVNNAMMYLFNEISYSINDVEIERIKNPGQVTSMLGYLKYPDDFSTSSGLRICWSKDSSKHANSQKYAASPAVQANAAINAGHFTPEENPEYNHGFAVRKSFLMSSIPKGNFEFSIPFSHMFGFSEFRDVIWGAKHTLKLTPDSDKLAIYRRNGVGDGEIYFRKIAWSIPYVKPNPINETNLLNFFKDHSHICPFRVRTTFTKSVPEGFAPLQWELSVAGGGKKPRWVIVGFQTNRNTTQEQNPALFDNLSIADYSLELNSDKYPFSDNDVNFTINKYSKLYNSFNNFKNEYYGYDDLVGGNQVNFSAFRDLFPIIVFDVRHQDENTKNKVISMSLTFKFHNDVPPNTMGYACVISDKLVEITPEGRVIST